MTENPLLALLERAHPGRPRDELLRLIDETPDREPQKSPQKPAGARSGSRPKSASSIERRRSWCAQGWMPPRLACKFTPGEMAVLSVVAEQVAKCGSSTLPLDHVAALAGVCRTTVRNALKQAKGLGLLQVQERRLSAWRNLPHLITIISPEWLAWLRMRSSFQGRNLKQGGGRKSVRPTNTGSIKQAESRSTPNGSRSFRQAEGRVRWRETRF